MFLKASGLLGEQVFHVVQKIVICQEKNIGQNSLHFEHIHNYMKEHALLALVNEPYFQQIHFLNNFQKHFQGPVILKNVVSSADTMTL